MDNTFNFFKACELNDVITAYKLSQNLPIKDKYKYFNFAFHYACLNNQIDVAKWLYQYIPTSYYDFYLKKTFEKNFFELHNWLKMKVPIGKLCEKYYNNY